MRAARFKPPTPVASDLGPRVDALTGSVRPSIFDREYSNVLERNLARVIL
jgi:hypothetical protein